MIKSQKSRDSQLARNLHEEINCLGITENAILPKNHNKENYKPRTLIDRTLELIDPTPNIHTLFVQFNTRFFWNILLPVEVKWSNRMTSCAGVCTFHPRNRQCVISLSAPLLKLRPRKDLVETLLHEMIHGYLFLTNNNRDRDGHGPEFCKHMHRINKEAGTSISIYHDFHGEVKLYQQHWWKCNGPCQKRAPYFGTVRRAMNRPPGASDYWWKEHQQNCGGQFIKIKEPENFKIKKAKDNIKTKHIENTAKISDWFSKDTPLTSTPKSLVPKYPKIITKPRNNIPITVQKNDSFTSPIIKGGNTKSLTGIKKLGNAANNVYGWSTGGPNSSINNSYSPKTPVKYSPKFSCSGTLGGTNLGQSNLLYKFDSMKKKSNIHNTQPNFVNHSLKDVNRSLVNCPACRVSIAVKDINEHLDVCLNNDKGTEKFKKCSDVSQQNSMFLNQPIDCMKSSTEINHVSIKKRKTMTGTLCLSTKQSGVDMLNDVVNCPVCEQSIQYININEHLNECFTSNSAKRDDQTDNNLDLECKDESVIVLNSSSDSDKDDFITDKGCSSTVTKDKKSNVETHNCLVCNALITPEISLNDHLEECIGTVFNDDSMSFETEDENDMDTTDNQDVKESKYPCPVCMKLICEPLMNEHLDMCLIDNQQRLNETRT